MDPGRRPPAAHGARRLVLAALGLAIAGGLAPVGATRGESVGHMLVSEVVTGGASASDEFIELHNPAAVPLPLANLEVAYASASGATVGQRASWGADAPPIPAGGFVLLANSAGAYAAIADVLYAGGVADTGGTVILRAIGGPVVDAVGWGTAGGGRPEGTPAPAPRTGFSLQRVSGSAVDGLQDTDDNAADFAEGVPSPRAMGPPVPSTEPLPTMTPPGATPPVTPSPTTGATSLPAPLSIEAARGMPDGSTVTVTGAALTGSDFHDGGGFVADAEAGIAVIVEDGSFTTGRQLLVTGTIDDRFGQRTIRARAPNVAVLGDAEPIESVSVSSGSVGEAVEGRLVRLVVHVRSGPTPMAAGHAYEVDDGTGAVRVVVGSSSGVDTSAWAPGASLELIGVVGQRDSSGTGTAGYRVQPRTPSDVVRVTGPAPSGAASPSGGPGSPTGTASPDPDRALVTVADARASAVGTALTVRGVVTMPSEVVDTSTAVIQDDTAAIVLRLGADAGGVRLGDLLEVEGTRSTKGGMATLRVADPPKVVGSERGPAPARLAAADIGERTEAQLVVVRGVLPQSARRAGSGTVSFSLEDAGASVRVVVPASLEGDDRALVSGASVEVIGVVGQETTGSEPEAGYRLWPRSAAEVRLLATPGHGPAPAGTGNGPPRSSTSQRTQPGLEAVGTVGLGDLRIGATLVAAAWPELGIGGLLWDGERLVAISEESAEAVAALAPGPLSVELSGLRSVGAEPIAGLPLVALADDPTAVAAGSAPLSPPRAALPEDGEPPAWVTLVGLLRGAGSTATLEVGTATIGVDVRCSTGTAVPAGSASVTGIGLAGGRLIVPCEGIRAAPTLSAARAGQLRVSPPVDPAVPVLVPSPPGDARRTAAVSLLGVAFLTTCAALAARRRLRRDWAEVATEVGETAIPPPDRPHPKLVSLRRERGS